jgi:hypothetical protein
MLLIHLIMPSVGKGKVARNIVVSGTVQKGGRQEREHLQGNGGERRHKRESYRVAQYCFLRRGIRDFSSMKACRHARYAGATPPAPGILPPVTLILPLQV